ncbi:MAG: methionine synthase [Marinilabilia sp.]
MRDNSYEKYVKQTIMEILKEIQKRILVLDGAMGTMVQNKSLTEEAFRGERFKSHPTPLQGLNDALVLSTPNLIKEIHQQYLKAGADIITTNTFNANYFSLKEYGLESLAEEINHKAVALAREVTTEYTKKNPEKPRFVAATLGPTGKTASISPEIDSPAYRDVTFDQLAEAYSNQARALIEAGTDILMVETVFDTLNAKAALYAIQNIQKEKNTDIPVMVSVTIDESGRNLSGQTVEAFYNSLTAFPVFSIGLNCSFGPDKMLKYLERLSRISELPVSTHPNAGLPDEAGEYSLSPKQMGAHLKEYSEKGFVNIVGGCCGSKPEHIAAIAKAVEGCPPREIPAHKPIALLSGLEPFQITGETSLIKVAEKTNVSGSKQFARCIREERYEDALELARQQVQEGSDMLNINLDESMIKTNTVIKTFLNQLQSEPDIATVPVMLDSSDFRVIENGLKCLQGKTMVNSISLKDGEEAFKQKASLIRDLGALPVVMAFDEEGQANTFARKTEICQRAYEILTNEMAFPPENIVFDPVVLTIGTGIEEHNKYAADFIRAVEWIRLNLPHAKVNAGISNVSFAFRGNNYLRDVINSIFLHHCEKAGLNLAIVHPGKIIPLQEIPETLLSAIEDMIFNNRKDATDRLVEMASEYSTEERKQSKSENWRELSPENRLAYAMRHGTSKYIEEDLQELKKTYDRSLDIVQGPLMDSMKKVGELFGAGKMFLPQVIKSARIMNRTVELLKDDIERETKESGRAPEQKKKILIATVEGDVHDIGKNIVALVLRCNGYEVIDLGVKISARNIVDAVQQEKPDLLGLSGLITPSLNKMRDVLKLLKEENLQLPVLLGGAATSGVHTAVKAAPLYNGPVLHVSDAMKSVNAANAITGKKAETFLRELKEEQKNLLKEFHRKKSASKFLPLDEARKRRFIHKNGHQIRPNMLDVKYFDNFDIDEIERYIDWTPFFHGWSLKGKYPSIFEKDRVGPEAKRLFDEARAMLKEMKEKRIIQPRGVIGLFPANSEGDDILIFKDEKREEVLMKMPMLRQQHPPGEQSYTLSLADFVAPVESGIKDYFGGFAVTSGHGLEKHVNELKSNGDSYNSVMFRLITDRLVEAAAEMIHEWVRKEYWGYDPDEELSMTERIQGKYKGIRPAIGYPICPDHRLKRDLFDLLEVEKKTGIELTETYVMKPASSVSGFYLANDASKYFGVGKIGKDQLHDYAERTGQTIENTKKWLHFALKDEDKN